MTSSRIRDAALVTIAAIMIIAGLSLASSVFAPAACALLIIAIVWPLHARLQAHMPKYLALAISIVLMIAVFCVFGSLGVWAFGRVGRWFVAEAGRFQSLHAQATLWLEGHGIVIAGMWAEYFNVGWLLRIVQGVTGRLNTTLSFWLIVFVYVILGLLEVEEFGRKARAMGNRQIGQLLLEASVATAAKLRRYMLVRTQMSLVTGLLVWAFARLVGLELAMEWGIIAFVLNYIPFIGPFFATMFPSVFAMAQFESWYSVLGLFIGLNVVQSVVGSYIEPRVSGNALSISPSIVLFSIFLWAFLWGIFGAFIGVPITIAVLTFCSLHPSSRWLAELLGKPPDAPPPPPVTTN